MPSSWTDASESSNGRGLREQEVNRLLRRVDWRFLLPQPALGSVACYTTGDLFDALRLVSSSAVSPETAPAGACDLVAAVDPDAATLRAAYERLRSRGACYVEFTGAGAKASVACRSLEAAGFRGVRVYRAWPSAHDCRAWLPLHESWVANAYFNQNLSGWTGVVRRLARRSRRALIHLGDHATVPRVSAIALKGGADTGVDVPPMADVLRVIRTRWSEFGVGGAPPDADGLVLQTMGRRSNSKVVALFFRQDQSAPVAVAKFARVPEAASLLVSEAETLQALHRLPGVPAGVPRVVSCSREANRVAVVETAMAGAPVPPVASASRYAAVARAATRWLSAFATASRRAKSAWEDVSQLTLAGFEASYAGELDPAMVTTIRQRFARVPALPAVCEHRDFAPWNVFMRPDGGLTVYDWESSVLSGVPALDLIYFLSYLASSPAALDAQSYKRAWDPDTPRGRINRECLESYARSVGIAASTSTLTALRLLTWIVHARSEHRRLVADHGSAATGLAQRSTFLRLIEIEASQDVSPASS